MSTTVSYKGNTLTTVDNNTKTLETEGKYLEADIILTDVSQSTPTLQTKSVSYTPTTSQQTAQITADNGYDGLQEVDVTANAMPSGTSKNTQIVQGTTRSNATVLTAIGSELTVSKTGTYDIYWSGMRSNTSTSYTWGTQLYIGGAAHGTENTTWSNNVQNNHLTNVSLTANQKLRVYGRGRGSSYYVYAPMLAIVEA